MGTGTASRETRRTSLFADRSNFSTARTTCWELLTRDVMSSRCGVSLLQMYPDNFSVGPEEPEQIGLSP